MASKSLTYRPLGASIGSTPARRSAGHTATPRSDVIRARLARGARDGASRQSLRAVADVAMDAWDPARLPETTALVTVASASR